MTTPTGRQQSEEQATRNGVTALEQAFSGVQRCRQDVDSMKNTLSSGYAGSDGGAFQQLLERWDQQAEIISVNLNSMIDTLNETLRAKGLQQGAAVQSIQEAYDRSEAIFNELAG
ncbi:WXG100 family type VII secretion target [Streptomyces pseudovenezuelae]|uniref:WXG100 family type VII secretion target n=1 Tax=Streptomyces pseudovenezuelae TaxID=67350 RepID=A0A101N1V2_9ACTN|nr:MULTISPECIES: WXG100 family type VII secretion target [Streptomyces]KUM85001.1 hypothetical protein AQI94_31305 [Streptomyces pseudovenezuelae]WUA93783.1 WXG100 family type VII secretion target [Streptomyces pseudovenezuelae]